MSKEEITPEVLLRRTAHLLSGRTRLADAANTYMEEQESKLAGIIAVLNYQAERIIKIKSVPGQIHSLSKRKIAQETHERQPGMYQTHADYDVSTDSASGDLLKITFTMGGYTKTRSAADSKTAPVNHPLIEQVFYYSQSGLYSEHPFSAINPDTMKQESVSEDQILIRFLSAIRDGLGKPTGYTPENKCFYDRVVEPALL